MFDTLTRLTSRIAQRATLRRAEAVTYAATGMALASTLLMRGYTVEANPVVATLESELGWLAAGTIGAIVLVGIFGVYGRFEGVVPRTIRLGGWLIATIAVVDVVINVTRIMMLGIPMGNLVMEALLIVGAVCTIFAVGYLRETVFNAIRLAHSRSPPREPTLSIALSIIMLTSMVGGVAFVGTQPLGGSATGTASAGTVSDGEEVIYAGGGDNVVRAVDPETGDVIWSTSVAGSYGVNDIATDGNYVVAVTDLDAEVYVLDATNGSVVWSAATPDYPKSAGITNGTALVGERDSSGRVIGYDAETGNELFNNSAMFGNDAESLTTGPDGHAYVGIREGPIYKVNVTESGLTEVYSKGNGGTNSAFMLSTDGETVVGGGNQEYAHSFDDETQSTHWSTSSGNSLTFDAVLGDAGDYLYYYNNDVNEMVKKDAKTGDTIYTTTAPSGSWDSAGTLSDGSIITASGGIEVLDPATGDVKRSLGVSAASVASTHNRWDAQPVTVEVTDQDGNPVNDSTVQATVVDQDALDTSNLNQTAQELLDEAENPEPPSYDARMNLNSVFDDVDAEYVSVHPESQMSTIEASTGGLDPDVQVRSGEEIYLMSWDATDEPGFLSSDLINRQLPGSPTSSTIVIEQLDHSGDVTETRKLKTENPEATASIGYVDILDDYSSTHVSTSLPDGFYRISTENSDFAYVIAVGNPAQIIEQELKDEADRLTDHAKKMQDRHNNGIFQTVTGETNATGETTLNIPSSASVIQVQAYKGPDASVVGASTTADITMQDVRNSRAAGYDEAIHLSTEPTRVDMSKTDGSVTVEMHKLDGSPMSNMTDWEQRLEDLLNERLNASIAELESAYDDRLETVKREELERRHDDLRSIVDRAGLMDRVEELLGRSLADTDTGSDAELQEDLRSMEQALAEQQSQGSNGEETTEIDSGELFTEIPFASEIDPEAISVIVHTEAGESITLPDREYSIESNGIIDGGDTVVIDGYDLPTDTAVADVEVRGVSPAGRTLRERVSAVNPKMSGSVPGLDAIDVNTLRPGPDERVGLQLRPNDADAYDSLSSVDVYGPDGQTIATTLDGERAYFDTEGEGVYTIRATYAGSDGTEFVETIRLRAGSKMISERPTVRITEGLGGPTAIVGQGLDSATIETTDGETTITARQPGDATSAPGEIHIEAQQLDASNTITVNVVRGELEESVNAHTNVVLHTNEIGDDALVYRDGKPVTADGDTKHGEYETRENADGVTKTVLYTYSESDGTVQMSISEDPGVVERVFFDLRVRSPVDVPLVGMLTGAVSMVDSVPLGPTAALQTVDMPELRESDPGAIVSGTTVTNTPGVIAT